MNTPNTRTIHEQYSIGEYLTITANENEYIRVVCEEGEFAGRIIETPRDVPTQDHQQFEITVADDTHPRSFGGVITVQINSIDEWGMSCYCFGQEYINEDYELQNLKEVKKILLQK